MISKDYKQNKKQVLALYEDFKKTCEDAGNQVSPNIEIQAQKIRDEIFNLMILGEAKSGKSTFINAFIGKEVVPMDVRQCTSAIIKINRGKEFKLIAKSAAGGQKIISGDEAIREFLKNHAAISDKYRNIPITTINNEILIKYKGKKIYNKTMETFLAEEAKDNIFNIDTNEYNRLIKEYIEENKNNWGKIITEIEISYPLPEAMQGITLIDSPGVGAGGNVGTIAENYIKNANAIIFVKYLKGQALESTAFMNFLRNNCLERNKESLFLVLNGKSDLQGSEYVSLMEQAAQMYGNDIKTEKILGVDSKVQLYLNKCKELCTEEAIDAYFEKLDVEDEDFAPASNCWLRSMRKGGLPVFEEKMKEMSNFGSVHVAIEKFAHVANYLQLIEFLENMENECKRYRAICSSTLSTVKKYINDPEVLADKIKTKKKEISDVYNKMNAGIDKIQKKYGDIIDGEGVIVKEAEKRQAVYEEKLANFKKLPEDEINNTTFDSMKKMTMDAIDDAKEFRREIANKLIEQCNQELIQYTNDPEQIPAEAYVPNFTESDFAEINNEAREKTSGYEEKEEGMTFTSVERVPYHHLRDHVKLVANSISNRLKDDIIPKMKDNAINYLLECTKKYKEQLDKHKMDLDNEFQKLLDKQKENESFMKQVEDLEHRLQVIETGLSNITCIKEELNNYVAK